MKRLHKVAVLTAVVLGCGSPTPPGGSDEEVEIECPGADAECGTLRIDSDLEADLEIRLNRLGVNATSLTRHLMPFEMWAQELAIVVQTPTPYIVCATPTNGGDYICRAETLLPGESKVTHCYFDEEQEKRAVRVKSSSAPPGAKAAVDGVVTAAGPGEDVQIAMDGNIHTISIVDQANDFTCMHVDINTASTVPSETPELDCGWDPSLHNWECTATDGPFVGQTSRPAVEVRIDSLALAGLPEGLAPGFVGTRAYDEDDERGTAEVQIDIAAMTINVRLTDRHGVEYANLHHTCHP